MGDANNQQHMHIVPAWQKYMDLIVEFKVLGIKNGIAEVAVFINGQPNGHSRFLGQDHILSLSFEAEELRRIYGAGSSKGEPDNTSVKE